MVWGGGNWDGPLWLTTSSDGGASFSPPVELMTSRPAQLFGLVDRGRIVPGAHADLVLFDPATVGSEPPRLVADFPGGSPRLTADPVGIAHVLVGGVPVVEDGRSLGALPGTLLRSGRDTQ